MAEVFASFGDAYYWDNGKKTLYLRVVSPPDTFGSRNADPPIWSPFPVQASFSRGGLTLISPAGAPTVVITAHCGSDPCAPQNDVVIPDALYPEPIISTSFENRKQNNKINFFNNYY